MYVKHDMSKGSVAKFAAPTYRCHICFRYFTPEAVKEYGFRWTKRTRMGRQKIPLFAHIVIPRYPF